MDKKPTDYLGSRTVDPTDKLDHGVKGMKWGIRRSPAQLDAAAKKRSTGESDSSSDKPSGPETSQARYTRLKAQATEKGAGSLSDEDLKFFNARSEAMKKVAKLTQQQPGWLATTSKAVLQETAKQSMQSISSAVAKKYINDRVIASLGTKAEDAAEAANKKK